MRSIHVARSKTTLVFRVVLEPFLDIIKARAIFLDEFPVLGASHDDFTPACTSEIAGAVNRCVLA